MVEDKNVDADAIKVETLNGNVVLSGVARSPLEKSTAENIAMKVQGVKTVQNQTSPCGPDRAGRAAALRCSQLPRDRRAPGKQAASPASHAGERLRRSRRRAATTARRCAAASAGERSRRRLADQPFAARAACARRRR